MTRKTFYNKLKTIAPRFEWEFEKNGTLIARSTRSFCGETFFSQRKYCPVTAVCFGLGLGNFTRENYDHAARLINFDLKEAEDIVVAADNQADEEGFNLQTRRTILKAVGLVGL